MAAADVDCVEAPGSGKPLRLRRADKCAVCGLGLAVGTQAIWFREHKKVTCTGCRYGARDVIEGQAGRSALHEYERRRQQREEHARGQLGRLGVFLAKVIDEPQSTRAWKQGGDGEVKGWPPACESAWRGRTSGYSMTAAFQAAGKRTSITSRLGQAGSL